MKILIAQAQITDQRHPDNGRVMDILVEDGIISKVDSRIDAEADLHIRADGLCVSIGWMDMRANFRDPGDEHKENLESGMRAAAAGGFTAVALSPATNPPADGKGNVAYIINRGGNSAVQMVPVGSATKGLKGESLAEMYDMYAAGAPAFGDDKHSMRESGMLQLALLYSKNFGAPIMHFPFDASLIPGGQAHEGINATVLGLKGIPAMSEELITARDLSLLAYTEGTLHLGPLSTAHAVNMVHAARESGLKASCETTAAHLAYTDDMLNGFDSNFKLMPPLRDEANRQALLQALLEGKIQVISSDHSPEDEEHKKLEFDFANFGTAGIESFFHLVYAAVGDKMPLAKLIATFSIHPREILKLDVPEIKVGQSANLTLFSPKGSTKFSGDRVHTRAYNFAERNQTLQGRVIGIIRGAHCVLNEAAGA